MTSNTLFSIDAFHVTVQQPTTQSSLDAAWNIRGKIISNKGTIQSVEVRKRRIELTLEERYAIYLKGRADQQAHVLKEAADHPECTLRNSYTHVSTLPFSVVDHAFMNGLNIPRYK